MLSFPQQPDLPPHFPRPDFDPVAHLEEALRERDEMLAEAHREAKAWQAQLEDALRRLTEAEAALLSVRWEAPEGMVDEHA